MDETRRSSSPANNMESKGTNIPTTNAHETRQSSNNDNLVVSSREATKATTTTTTTTSTVVDDEDGSSSVCARRKPIVTSEKESTNDLLSQELLLQQHQQQQQIKESVNNSNINPIEEGKGREKVHRNSDSEKGEESDCNKGSVSSVVVNNNNSLSNSKPPVPNFRVEGSVSGESSVTSYFAVGASVSRGSTGGSNSLENGDQPSSSGPVSMQSSEEMRLSLVSWYSEPEVPSRLIVEGCCSALNTYRGSVDENGVVIDDIDVNSQNNSMGHEATSSISVTNNSSPVCESEEKENKTPEPSCGNIKMNDSDECTNTTTTTTANNKSEFVNPSSNKKTDAHNNTSCNNTITSSNVICDSHDDETRGNLSFADKSNDPNSHISSSKSTRDSSKVRCSTAASHQKSKGNVHLTEQNKTCSSSGGHIPRCQQDNANRSSKPECPRCSRRSKSGTTTPASGPQVARASRRVVQSSKSSTEIKKPIKSILKHDSKGSASGSGSDKQSSMDSLGSNCDYAINSVHNNIRGRVPSAALMTRSDSGARARFNFSNGVPTTPTSAPVSKLKRIEKYATLRVKKNIKPRPLDFNDSHSNDASHSNSGSGSSTGKVVGVPGAPTEIMSKSMSYLEKSSNRVHITSPQGQACGESISASSTLKRQGSLRAKKHSSPQWEPSGTRTSALRLQKMQEAKAKTHGGGGGGASSGSANSGSGDSLHYLPYSSTSTGASSIHLSSASSSHHHARMSSSAAAKEKHMGAKIFSKLSSALGQTASSNQKRIRQERGVQTEIMASSALFNMDHGATGRVSVSPVPILDSGAENVEHIKSLERLCSRYRNQFMKVQSEYERSELKSVELQKQLEETQHESTEMIEFLQAEKSTLAESLTEVEVEAKKWKDEMESIKKDYESRCSSLVRLSEQHKQEALKSQALLHRLESQSTSVISQLSHQITDGAQSIQQTKLRITTLTESLMKTYKVPPELLAASETNQTIKETDLSCSLLLPLITSLSAAFPMIPMESLKSFSSSTSTVPITHHQIASAMGKDEAQTSTSKLATDSANTFNKPSTSMMMTECSSFQSLNQAILEREAAEKSGLDDIMKPFSLYEGVSPDTDQVSLRKEIIELNVAIAKLLCLVRVIVIHCDRKVSSVASSILQCLKSIEDDKKGNMAEIAQVQKSLEAWSDKGISPGNTQSSSGSNAGSPPFKTTTPTTVGDGSASYLVGNGHAHV